MPFAHDRARHGLRSLSAIICLLSLLLTPLPTARRDAPDAPARPHVNAQAHDSTQTQASAQSNAPLTRDEARAAYGRIELSFEANRGQTAPEFDFLSRGAGYALFLQPTEAVFVLSRPGAARADGDDARPEADATQAARVAGTKQAGAKQAGAEQGDAPSAVLRMALVGADKSARAEGADELEGKVNYLLGDDPSRWRVGVPTYARVRYQNVYPGVDVVYYGNQRQLEYDFVVAPGRDPRAVRIAFEGADKLELEAASGDLLLSVGGGVVRQQRPVVYQEVAGARRAVEADYTVGADGQVGFALGGYDRSLPLVIDPVIVYSTYLGGSDFEEGSDIKVDSAGQAYVCGSTSSTNFPTANAIQPTFGGATFEGGRDGFVTKLNAAGTAFVYSTYLGGSGDDQCNKVAVDSAGNAYLAGETTSSTNFPRANAFQNTFGGGLSDAFVTKLNANGSALIFSTYLGGEVFDAAVGIALDSSNNVYVTGRTTSPNFPTANAIQATQAGIFADAFVTKLNAAGSALVYSTYLGGSDGTEGGFENGFSIAVDSAGSAYVVGQTRSTNFPTVTPIQATFGGGFPDGDAFVTKVNAAGTAFVYSTYLGGSENDIAFEIDVDAAGSAYVAGVTRSTNFPTANAIGGTLGGPSDAFLTKLNAAGTAFAYSTYFGGTGDDSANGVAVGADGRPYITGGTSSADFPLAAPLQSLYGGGIDAFVTQFNANASGLVFSTYLGGSALDAGLSMDIDSSGGIYIVGRVESTNFPVVTPIQNANGGDRDTFITKLGDAPLNEVRFSANAYNVAEGAGGLTVTVNRTGDVSFPATVAYATAPDAGFVGCDVVNGVASERCDFTTTLGTLRFAAGESSKTFTIFITDDSYADGNETFGISLSSPSTGLTLGTPSAATVTITDNDPPGTNPNPILTAPFFVRMHYIDFLNREGEPSGVNAWVNALNNCPPGNEACDRVGVSSSFFRSEEFMLKGLFVIRFYKVSLGPPPTYREFMRDSQRVTAPTSAEVLAAREAFANEWVQRPDFKAIYDPLSNQAYVDRLEQTAGVTLANKAQLVAALDANTKTRAQVLREIVESEEVRRRMFNDAFVLMEYYGYLRRDPEPGGFQMWLDFLNANPTAFRTMVNGFVNSIEYRKRFGQP